MTQHDRGRRRQWWNQLMRKAAESHGFQGASRRQTCPVEVVSRPASGARGDLVWSASVCVVGHNIFISLLPPPSHPGAVRVKTNQAHPPQLTTTTRKKPEKIPNEIARAS